MRKLYRRFSQAERELHLIVDAVRDLRAYADAVDLIMSETPGGGATGKGSSALRVLIPKLSEGLDAVHSRLLRLELPGEPVLALPEDNDDDTEAKK